MSSRTFHPGAVFCDGAALTKFYARDPSNKEGTQIDRVRTRVSKGAGACVSFLTEDERSAELKLSRLELYALRDALIAACDWSTQHEGPLEVPRHMRGVTSETGRLEVE